MGLGSVPDAPAIVIDQPGCGTQASHGHAKRLQSDLCVQRPRIDRPTILRVSSTKLRLAATSGVARLAPTKRGRIGLEELTGQSLIAFLVFRIVVVNEAGDVFVLEHLTVERLRRQAARSAKP